MTIPATLRLVVLLATALLPTACGDDPEPSPRCPPGPRSAPEQIAEAACSGLPLGAEVLTYRCRDRFSEGAYDDISLTISPDGTARLDVTVSLETLVLDMPGATGGWEVADSAVHLQLMRECGVRLDVYARPVSADGRCLEIWGTRLHESVLWRPVLQDDGTASESEPFYLVLHLVSPLPEPGEGAR